MAGQLVYHWKHGWIPLTHAAALSKAHGSHTGAAKVAKQYGIAGDRHAAGRFKVEKSKHLSEGAANSHHVVDTHAGKVARDNKGQLAYFSSSTKAHEFANELNAAHHQGLAPSPAAMDAAGKRHIEETIDKPRAEAAKRSLENAAKIQPGSGAAPSTAAKKGDLALVTKTSNDTVRNDSGSYENRKSVSHFFAHIERVDKNGRVTHVRPLDSHIGQPIEAFRERRSGEHAKLHVVGQDQVNIPALSQAIDNRPHHNFFHGDAGFAEARDLAKAHRGSTPQRIVDVPAGLHVERRSGNGVQSAGWHVVHSQSGKTMGFRTDTKAEAEDAAGHLGRTGVNFDQPVEGVGADLKTHQAAVSDVVHKAQVKHGLEPLRAEAPAAGARDGLAERASAGDYNDRRAAVYEAAKQGRATLVPAGARDSAVAMVHIDGKPVGASTSIGHYVREDPTNTSTFGEKKLIPGYDRDVPNSLRNPRPPAAPSTGPMSAEARASVERSLAKMNDANLALNEKTASDPTFRALIQAEQARRKPPALQRRRSS